MLRLGAALVLALLAMAPSATAATTAGFEVDGNELSVRGDDVDEQTIEVTRNPDGSYTVYSSTGIAPSQESWLTGCTQGANENFVNCTIAGVDGRDVRILGDEGAVLSGSGGKDTICAACLQTAEEWGAANVYVDAGPGDDTVTGSPSEARPDENEADYLNGGTGNDVIEGREGADFLTGGGNSVDPAAGDVAGTDELYGGDGDDTLMDGDGDTPANVGADTIKGGPRTAAEAAGSSDTVTYADDRQYATRTAGVTVDLGVTTATQGQSGEGDTISGVENVVGTDQGDDLTGSGVSNTISAGGGEDTVDTADTVSDTVDCGTAADSLTRDTADLDVVECENVSPALIGSPGGFTATAAPGGVMNLDWEPVEGATDYAIYMRGPSGYTGFPDDPIAGSPTDSARLDDFAPGVNYCFRVSAVTDAGSSGLSEEDCATALAAPGGGGGGTGGGGTGGGGGATTGPVTTGPTAAQIKAVVRANVGSAARVLAKLGLLKLLGRGVTVAGRAPEVGAVTYYYYLNFRTPTASASARRRVVVARGKKALKAAGPYKLKIKATKKGRKLLRRARKVRGTLVVRFRGKSGKVTTQKRKLTLKRRKRGRRG